MHIISHAKIVQAQAAHPDCSAALDQWYLHFNAGKVFVRAVLTHKAYDKGDWK